MTRTWAIALGLAALASGGCKKNDAKEKLMSLGERIAEGRATDLRTTPDGKYALYLKDGEKPRLDGIPPQMLIGELHAVPTSGGKAREVGSGVTNMPGGFTFSPDSRWVLFLSGYNPVAQDGTLKAMDLADEGARAVELGPNVSYVLVSPDSRTVAFVSAGVLQVGELPMGPFRRLAGEVQTADFTEDASHLFFKRRLGAAGGLFVWKVGDEAEPVKLADQVGDFASSPDSKHLAFTKRSVRAPSTYDLLVASGPEWTPKEAAAGTVRFAFSPDSKWLGRIQDLKLEDMGSIQVGALHVGPADGGPSRKVADRVGAFEFAPTSDAIALLDSFQTTGERGAGVLAVAALPDGAPKRVARHVPNFDWAPDGKSIAFIGRVFEPIYTIDLFFYPLGADGPLKLHPGVFGYDYDRSGENLYFRANCTGGAEGRFCDLMRSKVADPKAPAQKVAEGIYSWQPSADGKRILLTYARRDARLYDAAVLNVESGERKTVAQYIHLPALWVEDASRVVYVVAAPAPSGVYAASRLP